MLSLGLVPARSRSVPVAPVNPAAPWSGVSPTGTLGAPARLPGWRRGHPGLLPNVGHPDIGAVKGHADARDITYWQRFPKDCAVAGLQLGQGRWLPELVTQILAPSKATPSWLVPHRKGSRALAVLGPELGDGIAIMSWPPRCWRRRRRAVGTWGRRERSPDCPSLACSL